MKIFLDANILVSVLNKEYPAFTHTSRILSLGSSNRFQLFTSPICLAIAFYFSEKKFSTSVARQKIGLLAANVSIAPSTASSVHKALNNLAVNDFEDGLEYYAAKEAHCKCIITEDTDDFYFSDIEVLDSTGFFEKYMVRR